MVIGIGDGQSVSSCLNWVNTHHLTYPVLADSSGSVFDEYTLGAVPHNTVLDCGSIVLYTYYGFDEEDIMTSVDTGLEDVTAVSHYPRDTENITDPIPVSAMFEIIPAIESGYPLIYWSNDGGANFYSLQMAQAKLTEYTVEIPSHPAETTIHYYFEVKNVENCTRTVPPMLPGNNFYSFFIGEDIIAPTINHTPLEYYPFSQLPLTISAEIEDNLGIQEVVLEFQINDGGFTQIPMTAKGIYSADITDPLNEADIVDYRIIATDASQGQNQTIDPVSGYYSLNIVDSVNLVIDLDSGADSGTIIRDSLNSYIDYYTYTTELPDNLSIYKSIFLCLGVYESGNHVLSSSEGDALAAYLDQGGNLYMEGGDTWYFDPATNVHSYFNISSNSDGSSDAGPIDGIAGTFTEGLSFSYSSSEAHNNFIDHLVPTGDAYTILQNVSPVYDNAVAFDGDNYKTIGSSVEIGGMSPITHRNAYIEKILIFFKVIDPPPPTETPLPTSTPTPLPPTNTPTPDPTSPPSTSTPIPTNTPEITTPTPTHTPSEPYIKVILNQSAFSSGDPFKLCVELFNPSEFEMVQEYVVLDVLGIEYFFWPGWTTDIDFKQKALQPGDLISEDILSFTWPQNAGSADNLRFWAAMISGTSGQIYGLYDMKEWSYTE